MPPHREGLVQLAARQGLGPVLIFLTTVCFACITTFSKLAFADGSNPETLLVLRFAGFALIIGLFQRLRGQTLRLSSAMLGPILGIECFNLMLSGGYLTAAAFIPVSLAVILLYTSPFLVALVAVLMGRERMTAAKGLTMVLAFAGVVMAVGLDLSQLDLRGVAAGLTAAAGMVLMITVAGSWMQRHDPVSLCVHASGVLTPLLALYLLAAGSFLSRPRVAASPALPGRPSATSPAPCAGCSPCAWYRRFAWP